MGNAPKANGARISPGRQREGLARRGLRRRTRPEPAPRRRREIGDDRPITEEELDTSVAEAMLNATETMDSIRALNNFII